MKPVLWAKRIILFLFFITTLISLVLSEADLEEGDECDKVHLIAVPNLKEIQIYAAPLNNEGRYFKILLYQDDDDDISCEESAYEMHQYLLENCTITRNKLICQDDECQFNHKNVPFGYYCFRMEIEGEDAPCFSKTVHLYNPITGNRRLTPRARTILICAIVGISFLVIVISVFTIMHFRRRDLPPKDPEIEEHPASVPLVEYHRQTTRSGRLFLLYFRDDNSHFGLVKTLSQIFEQYLQWDVTFVDENFPRAEFDRGVQTWVTDALLKSDKIVVVSSAGALHEIRTRYRRRRISESVGGGISGVFLVAWHLIVTNPVLVRNYKKLFQVKFENRNDNHWLPEIVPGRHFLLPSDFQPLVSEILGTTPNASSMCLQIQRRLAKSELFKSFTEAVKLNEAQRIPASSSDSDDSCWIRPGV